MTTQPPAECVDAPRLGIIISMFPELHETFILRELVALERRGLTFDIYSLQYPRDAITLPDALRLSRQRTHYAPLFGMASWKALARALWQQPGLLLRSIARVAWLGRDRPLEALKNLAILPRSLAIAEQGSARGTTHWHGHWANVPTTACWYVSRFNQCRWSAAIHGEDIFSVNRFLRAKLDAARFTVVCSGLFCRHLQTQLGVAAPARIHLNYHGLDPAVLARAADLEYEPFVGGTLRLVSIGRLVPTKGHDVLIRACARLRDTHGQTVALTLIGDGPEAPALQALARQQGIAGQIDFAGGLAFADVLDHLARAHVFILAPRLIAGQPPDGIPNVLAEAMALQRPVVTTRVSAIPELVEAGVSGHLVTVDDHVALADAVQRLACEPEQAVDMAQAGAHKVAQLFDQEQNIDELLGLFDHYVPGLVLPAVRPAASGKPGIGCRPDQNTQEAEHPSRVVLCIEALSVGGAEQMLVALANALVQRNWQVSVVCLSEAGSLASRLDARVSLHVLHKRPGVDFALARRLRTLLDELQPDVINSHLWVANLWVRLALFAYRRQVGSGRRERLPVIVTEHSRDSWKPRHYRLIDRLLARGTAMLVAVSTDTAAFYRDEIGVAAHKIRVINNGIEVARFANGQGAPLKALWAPEGQLLIGTVGRLVGAKNHARLLDAFALVQSRLPDTRLVIVGDGPERARLQAAVSARGLEIAVTLAGARDDIADVLSALDIFVLSSDREGHPLTALEAQAAGTPVVLPHVGGCEDALAREGTQRGGLLVAADAQALADGLYTLASDDGSRQQMADFARRHAACTFDLNSMVSRYVEVFDAASRVRGS